MRLRPFQRAFIRAVEDPATDTAVLSLSRGNGKSWLAAHLLARALTPGDRLHIAGAEYIQCAGSLEQARVVFRFVRQVLEPTGEYRFVDSNTRIGAVHKPTNTRLRVMSSNAKTAMGIVNCPLLVADEPGSWEVKGGELMFDAIQTAQGKPGSPLKAVYIGTLAPARSGWWPRLVAAGSRGSTHVTRLQGDVKRWDEWSEIRRVNPLANVDGRFRRKLLEERDAARADSAAKARFLSYRLNVPSGDESSVLLTVEDWDLVLGRPVPPRDGRPVVGLDMGAALSWCAAVAVWLNGRLEAWALAPGIPDLAAQEKRDRVPRGTYQVLRQTGRLHIAEGLRVPPARQLMDLVNETDPAVIVCDRFRLSDLRDTEPRAPVVERRTRWSEAAEDIRALRKMAKDGPLAVEASSRPLVEASLAVATVKNDDQGSVRLVKPAGNALTARDDVCAAAVLGAGSWERLGAELARPRRAYLGVVG